MRAEAILGLTLCAAGCAPADLDSRYPTPRAGEGGEAASAGGSAGSGFGGSNSGGSDTAGASAGSGGSGPLAANVAGANPRLTLTRVVASAGVTNPAVLIDGQFHNGLGAGFGQPSAAAPASVALEVPGNPTRLLAVWKDAGWNQYNSNLEGAPLDYQLEVSGDSTDGSDGTWAEVARVTGNPVNNRGHSFGFSGKHWLRFVVTAAPPNSTGVNMQPGVFLDEISVYDLSSTPSGLAPDSWFFFGDSITQLAYRRDIGAANMFDAQVAAETSQAFFPAMVNGGVGGDNMDNALARVDRALELNPDFKYFAIAFGTNDAWGNQDPTARGYEGKLRQLIGKIEDAGRVPVLARIPSSTRMENGMAAFSTLPAFNAVVDALQAELGLPKGPDMFQVIADTPASLGDDGVHPVAAGYVAMNRAWAQAVAPLYSEAE
jgi:lysophospholipase L1-like esterase